MDLIEFGTAVGNLKKHYTRMENAKGLYARGDGAEALFNETMAELKKMWLECPQVTRETKFEDLPFAIGPHNATLKEILFSEPVVEDEE